jgi:hypothetical protein
MKRRKINKDLQHFYDQVNEIARSLPKDYIVDMLEEPFNKFFKLIYGREPKKDEKIQIGDVFVRALDYEERDIGERVQPSGAS